MEDVHQRLLQLRDAAIVSGSESSWRLGYDCVTDALLAVYNECTDSNLSKNADISRFLKNYKTAVNELNKLRLKDEDFVTIGIIGRGHFGEVRVVKERSTEDIFAMKIMKKAHILQQVDAAFFLEERDIMAFSTSQWLTHLHYAFQNEHSLYLVMDFHPGGDLFTVMERREGGMNENQARFYLTEIIAGLNDLHILGFAHRDVKPDNVLITRSGHIKLVDFGSASRLNKNGKVMDTNLPVGTPEYISPEVLTSLDCKMEYGVCCDWWSVGIILYELLYDVTPFEGDSTAQTYANIMNFKTSLKFPDDIEVHVSEEAKKLIKCLLVESNNRADYSDIINHQFFVDTDWNNLTGVVPPFIPSINGPNDLSNFDQFDELKEEDTSDFSSKKKDTRFSGKDLPFVGFTFMRWPESMESGTGRTDENFTHVFPDLGSMASDIKKALEASQNELKGFEKQNTYLEKECIIYKSQLEDLQHKLEKERKERRTSDSKALKLLSEVREQSKVVQGLRDSQSKEAMQGAITQLEQERLTAIKRAQRIQEELKKKTLELDSVTAKVSDLRSKLSKVKESGRKEVTSLQLKLSKVVEDSRSRIAELQKDFFEIQDKYTEATKELKKTQVSKQKVENEYSASKLNKSLTAANQNDEIEKLQIVISELEREKERAFQDLQEALKENKQSSTKCQELALQLQMLQEQVETVNKDKEMMEINEWNLKQDLESSQVEITRLYEERKELVAACEELSAERDNKNNLLKKHEKSIDMLSNAKNFLESKISELEILATEQYNTEYSTDETIKAMDTRIKYLEEEREVLKKKVSTLEDDVMGKSSQLEKRTLTEHEEKQKIKEEIKTLEKKLSETTSSAIHNGEKLSELRKIKKELETENTRLKASLNVQQEQAKEDVARAEALTKNIEDKYTKLLAEIDGLAELRQQSDSVTAERNSLSSNNKSLEEQIGLLKSERDRAIIEEKKAVQMLADVKKQFEAQELGVTLLKRNIHTLEDELSDANTMMEEKNKSHAMWKEDKILLEKDLDIAESKLEDLYKQLKLEKEAKNVLEQQTSDLRCRLEEITTSHREEAQQLQSELQIHSQLAGQFSEKVTQLQRDIGLKELHSKETERSLEIERALTAKLYDDLHSLGREHGKLKASYLKLSKKLQNQESQLEVVAREKEKALLEKATVQESVDLERTKLKTQIAQFNKLVDFTPGVKTRHNNKKGMKLGRKKRDPVKERDEWKKLKDIAKGSIFSLKSPSTDSQSSNVSLSTSHANMSVDNYSLTSLQLCKPPLSDPQVISQSSTDIPATQSKTGHKRHADFCTMGHNIPHKWSMKTGRFHKNYSCAGCSGTIKKTTAKYRKCSYCGKVCHMQCFQDVPNNCGLPQQLALQVYPISPPKRSKQDSPSFDTRDEMETQTSLNKENQNDTSPSSRRQSVDTTRPLSINIIRCRVATPVLSSPFIKQLDSSQLSNEDNHDSTSLSITSSMLADSSIDSALV